MTIQDLVESGKKDFIVLDHEFHCRITDLTPRLRICVGEHESRITFLDAANQIQAGTSWNLSFTALRWEVEYLGDL